MRSSFVCVIFITFTTVYSWNTCSDEPFCDRIRNEDSVTSSFVLDSSLSIGPYALQAFLINEYTNDTFILSISAIETDIFHITIDDWQNPRTSISSQVLDGEPVQTVTTITQTSTSATITSGNNEALLEFSPFKISIYKNGDPKLIINDQGRMVFNSDDDDQSVAMDFSFPDATHAYGIPLHAERFALQNTGPGGLDPYRLYNVDHCCYDNFIQDSLYGAEPVLYGHGISGTTGIFWMNAAQTFVDINRDTNSLQSLFISERGTVDFFVLTGSTFDAAVKQYITLTGPAPLPQYFTLGYHQSRWSYTDQEDAETVIREFDNHSFPLETIWFDVDYTDNGKSFTWNYTAFPDPLAMQTFIISTGRKVLLIIHPHFSTEPGYFVYDTAIANDYFVKYPNGTIFQGEGWPGPDSAWLDFLNPEAAQYFSELYGMENFTDVGEDVYVWNDMNEPEVFDGFERSWDRSVIHYNNTPNKDVHNIYSLSQVRATYSGLRARYQDRKRPFILTRSHYSGSQRYSIVWTGDNNSTWSHLQISIPMCLSSSIGGISFCGADIGGFNGNLTDELFQRWYQAGAWMPFYRGHSTRYVERREPYLYSPEVQTRIRNAMRQRYYYYPLWYTLFYEHERFGGPVMRPMVYHYSTDLNTFDMDDQWLVGADVLVKPVIEENVTQLRIYLPGGLNEVWFDIVNNVMFYGVGYVTISVTMDSIPVYHRGGSILARKEVDRPASTYMHSDPYTIYVFLNLNNEATGTLYIDDNESFDYRNNEYNYFSLSHNGNVLSISRIDLEAEYPEGVFTIDRIIIYRPPSNYKAAVINDNTYYITYAENNIYLVIDNLHMNVADDAKIEFI